jgi:hypothetical protein
LIHDLTLLRESSPGTEDRHFFKAQAKNVVFVAGQLEKSNQSKGRWKTSFRGNCTGRVSTWQATDDKGSENALSS